MRKNVILICAALVFAAAPGIHAQVTEEWVARYNGPADSADFAQAIAVDDAGNVYVTGYSAVSYNTDNDYATIKYNSSGVEQWVARYDGPGNDYDKAHAIALDGEVNVYVTGFSASSETGFDYATVKYNTSGVEQWVARYDGQVDGGDDRAFAIALDGEANVYVTGYSERTNRDYVTVKYDTSGVQQWAARYNGPGSGLDEACAIALDGSDNVYVTGRSEGSRTGMDYATVKYNTSGVQQWAARYDAGNSTDEACAIAVDGSANVYVTGRSDGSGTYMDYATVKYNTLGVQQWASCYNGPADTADWANAIAVDGSGNVYVTGSSYGSVYYRDYATIKYNTLGVEQWVSRYDAAGKHDWALAIALDGEANVYVTGYSTDSGYNTDYATVKYNSSGVERWVARYDGPPTDSSDVGYAIALDSEVNVYVTGYSYGSGSGWNAAWDYATAKYSQGAGVAEELEPSSLMVSASLNRLRYNLPGSVTGLLSVYSADGQKVVSETVEGTGIWEAPAGLSQGVYFCRMQASAFSVTEKLVLIR